MMSLTPMRAPESGPREVEVIPRRTDSVYVAADERPYGRLAFGESRELTLRKGDPRADRTRRAEIRSLPLGCHTHPRTGFACVNHQLSLRSRTSMTSLV